ncbi:hypothetical protein Skr01_45540 [Sphaerisporangium krabiense]|nr:hypothetical protein Skr01_45540 [Sphaerisporangium krabiense]
MRGRAVRALLPPAQDAREELAQRRGALLVPSGAPPFVTRSALGFHTNDTNPSAGVFQRVVRDGNPMAKRRSPFLG